MARKRKIGETVFILRHLDRAYGGVNGYIVEKDIITSITENLSHYEYGLKMGRGKRHEKHIYSSFRQAWKAATEQLFICYMNSSNKISVSSGVKAFEELCTSVDIEKG